MTPSSKETSNQLERHDEIDMSSHFIAIFLESRRTDVHFTVLFDSTHVKAFIAVLTTKVYN
jgi:hypothetical protein